MQKKNENNSGVGIGLGLLAAAAATAAAGYFLYGKDGAKNRKKVKGWMLKAKGEVLEKIEKLKEVSEEDYNKIIDAVAEKYAKIKNIDNAEIETTMNDLRKHWKSIKSQVQPKAKKAVKKGVAVAKKTVNTAAKKVVAKTAAKPTPASPEAV